MSDIYSLLNINAGIFQDFPLLANRVADHQTEKVINKNMTKLKLIEDNMLVDKGLDVAKQSIDEIISKVIRMSATGDTSGDNWTVRELRIISYYLMKLRDNGKNYIFALDLLDNNWKNMFFNGLAFYLMNSWHSIEPEYREKTSQLLIRKLSEYTDTNRRYCLWKNHANLFDSNGPVRMAAMLAAKQMDIKDAPILLGFKNTSIKQPYYSDVIIEFIANNNVTDRDLIEDIFELHDLDRTKKLVFAYLVEKEDQRGDGLRRAKLCRFANTQLGDITLAASWAPFTGATDSDAQKLKNAMKLVNMWFAQQIIESFFEICVQDIERKMFWLEYVQYISGFKIVGSTAIKRLLQSNSKIGSMFLRHFIETNSYSSQTSALVLFIKNKMIVEFSDTGALYVYNQNHQKVKTVTNARYGIISTNDLKIPSMNVLIEANMWGGYFYYEEGRMTHQGYWQQRLNGWMSQMVLSAQNTDISFLDKKHDDVFKATPLPKENFEPLALKQEETTKEEHASPDQKAQSEAVSSLLYETTINCRIASKELDRGIRVVSDMTGFYLMLGKNRYAFIGAFANVEKIPGNIWIKKADISGWNEIVYNNNGASTYSVGFLKILTREVLFKKSLSVNDEIKFKI